MTLGCETAYRAEVPHPRAPGGWSEIRTLRILAGVGFSMGDLRVIKDLSAAAG
jgi:hypothetical protein